MGIKDKRNRGLIVGNYYRPSGSDKNAAQNVYADKDAQEKHSPVWAIYSSIILQQSDVLVTFLQETMGSVRAPFGHNLWGPKYLENG